MAFKFTAGVVFGIVLATAVAAPFARPALPKGGIPVVWIRAKDWQEASIRCWELDGKPKHMDALNGCHRMGASGIHYIVAVDSPAGLCTLGHELKHAYDGFYHPTKGGSKWNCDNIVRPELAK